MLIYVFIKKYFNLFLQNLIFKLKYSNRLLKHEQKQLISFKSPIFKNQNSNKYNVINISVEYNA